MAYNGFSYGNYPSYFQQNQQQDHPSTGSSNQRYQGQQNPYTPYYQSASATYGQQPASDQQPQDQRQPQQYQSKPTDSSNYPQSYYQSQQQPQSAQRQSSASGLYSQSRQYATNSSITAPSVSAATTTAPYHYSQTSASYGDTSGLGSLAYASSPGRNSPATSQERYSQPNATQTSYSSTSPIYSTQQGVSRRNSTASQDRTNQPAQYLHQGNTLINATQQSQSRPTTAASQYRTSQPAHSRVSSASSQKNRYPSPLQGPSARPAAAQNVHEASTNSQPPSISQQPNVANPATRPSNLPPVPHQSPGRPVSRQIQSQRSDKVQSPSLVKASYASAGSPRPNRQEDGPTTVNPSQVFDQVEYQRRKAAAEAEVLIARRAAEEAEAEVAKMVKLKAETAANRKAAKEARANAEAVKKLSDTNAT